MCFQTTASNVLELLSQPGRLPADREECLALPRPCLACNCRHHNWRSHKDISRILAQLAQGRLDELPPTCSLDVADQGEHSTDEVGAILGYTGERIRQLERSALAHMHSEFRKRNLHVDAADLMTAFFCAGSAQEFPVNRPANRL